MNSPTEIKAEIYNEDCIAGLAARVPDNSVHLTVTSIPFEELFTYSGKLEDVGNNGSTVNVRAGRFALNMEFVRQQLHRVTAPGCLVCIHIQQLLAYKNQHGFMGRRDFRGAMVDLFTRDGGIVIEPDISDTGTLVPIAKGDDRYAGPGFHFVGDLAIPKDPQAMAQRLSLHSLQFKTGHSRSSTGWAPAPNDYMLMFQKPGECETPVRPLVYKTGPKPMRRDAWYERNDITDPIAYGEYLRTWARKEDAINPTGWISPDDWIKWACGVWGDIDEFDIIDGARSARESDEEKHVCALQLEVIRRCVLLWSNPIDIQPDVCVLDPFMGVGSTAHECVLLNRNVIGFELKESYHGNAVKNVERARQVALSRKLSPESPGLFAGIEPQPESQVA